MGTHGPPSSHIRPNFGSAHLALSSYRWDDPGLPDFGIRIVNCDGHSVVYLSGELDAYTAARLRGSLAGLIGAGARHVVIDLTDLSFMAASGLGVLVGAGKRLRRDDGRLVLRSAPPRVQKMIEITGLNAMLPQL